MKKNVASQKVGAQMVSATDGSAFTSAVTVEVTIDAGTQATGTVGSGACTHEGGGYHTYAPSQAETNGDLVAFTFHGTGAVPATVQIYTSFPQTVDSATSIASILADTNELQTDWVNGGRLDLILDIIAADTTTDIPALLTALTAYVDTEVAAILALLDTEMPALTTAVADLPTNAELATALGTADDAVLTQIALVKAKTDSLTFTQAGHVDANIQRINDVVVTGDGSSGDKFDVV